MLFSLPLAIQALVTTFLGVSEPQQPPPLTFELRHEHRLTNTSRIVFSDVKQSNFAAERVYRIPRKILKIPRPSSHEDFLAARTMSMKDDMSMMLDWQEDEIPGPDVSSRDDLLQFAHMAFNTYYADNTTEWYDVSDRGWDKSTPHGWLPGEDGMRGHIFVSQDNSTVVIAIKGTSAGWLVGGGGPSTGKDKLNDNLLFSCCCARVGPTWSTVCGCHEGGYKCDQQCVQDALTEKEDLFYPVGLNLYNNVSYMYPNANIWITGHSLGGSLSSLIGVTFGAPVVAFEAPAEKLAAGRLHLPSPPSTQHVTHFYHTADPIAMGACNGVSSSCAIGGFAMETRCHLGQVIRLDTVSTLGWSVDVRTHGIKYVIDHLLGPNSEWPEPDAEPEPSGFWGWPGWPGKDKDEPKQTTGRLPPPRPAGDVEGEDGVCSDCFNWEFGDYRNASKTRR
ncbi:Alpha/Beta hydrolase protein [Ephemerocybe angulata]|uniref:triacylglycerol lipase n=1 Tax=Ephemerocybe angulata TaxID=980116 RepID=A0A8H6I3R1_9AGAR|nr:Alpha/Beta hydrolase protein [Tulosesus angulatus]